MDARRHDRPDDPPVTSSGGRRLRQREGLLGEDETEEDDLDARSVAYQRVVRESIEAQRRRVIELRDEGAISDEVLYVLERELDLEDQRLEI